jgi:hypothetical protein
VSEDRARYFQEISRAFLSHRGAPFFLSPKDLALVEAWEKDGLPLGVVLEGIGRAFERTPGRPGPRVKVLALAFCEPSVRRAFAQHRDRTVGGRRPAPSAALSGKRARVADAVDGLLARRDDVPEAVRAVYLEAKRVLEAAAEGETLEALDARVDALLRRTADPAEREAAERDIGLGHRELAAAARASAAETLLLKRRREKLRLPFLSPFYY